MKDSFSLVASILHKHGAEYVFLLPGAQIDPLVWELCEHQDIKLITSNHELSCGYMAEGYFRASGRFGIAMSIGGPGAAYMIGSVINAKVERIPVVYITGSVATSDYGSGCFQDTSEEGSCDRKLYEAVLGESLYCHDKGALEGAMETVEKNLHNGIPTHIMIPLDVQRSASAPRHHLKKIKSSDCRGIERDVTTIGCTIAANDFEVISYPDLMAMVQNLLPKDTIFCLDSGQIRYAGNRYLERVDPLSVLNSPNMAPMGWSIPVSMGVKLALPKRGVVCMAGDGSMRLLGSEILTAVKYNIPVIFIVCDNNAWGTVYSRFENTPCEEIAELNYVDWALFAQSFGIRSYRVVTQDVLADVLQNKLPVNEPILLWVRVPVYDGENV